jgi:hypothetical protein
MISRDKRREFAPRAAPQLIDRRKLQTEFARLVSHGRFGSLEHPCSSRRRAAALYVSPQPLDVLSAPDASVGSQCHDQKTVFYVP